MNIDIKKFEIALSCLEHNIEETKEDIKQTSIEIDKCDIYGFAIDRFKESLHQLKMKLNTLEFTYKNLKECIIE